jgi:hypothetical protein
LRSECVSVLPNLQFQLLVDGTEQSELGEMEVGCIDVFAMFRFLAINEEYNNVNVHIRM